MQPENNSASNAGARWIPTKIEEIRRAGDVAGAMIHRFGIFIGALEAGAHGLPGLLMRAAFDPLGIS